MCYHSFWRSALLLVLLGQQAFTASVIGPGSVLEIVNKVIAPDGVARDAVLAQGTFPGPTIVGRKVCHAYSLLTVVRLLTCILCHPSRQGDRFQINVVNKLVNETMLTSTSIVRRCLKLIHIVEHTDARPTTPFDCHSIGMAYINVHPLGQMVRRS